MTWLDMTASQVDKYESNRVWATTRLTGTNNGPLVFDGKVGVTSYIVPIQCFA